MRVGQVLKRVIHSKAILAVIATFPILFPTQPVSAQVTKLREVTDKITDTSERVLLQIEQSRLRIFFRSLERKVDIFNAECNEVEVGTYAFENCKIRFHRLEKERSAYNTDAKTFNALVEAAIKNSGVAADEDSGDGTSGDSATGAIPVKISIQRGTVFRSSGRSLSAPLLPGEEIRTSSDARVEIVFTNGDAIILGGDTVFSLVDEEKDAIGNIKFIKGKIISIIGCVREREVCRKLRTHWSTIAVRGTIFDLEVADEGSLELVVLEGVVEVTSKRNESVTSVSEGRRLRLTAEGKLVDLKDIEPADYNRWW